MAFQSFENDQMIIKLIVARSGGRVIDDDPAFSKSLKDYLDSQRDTSKVLEIESFMSVPVDIIIEIRIDSRITVLL